MDSVASGEKEKLQKALSEKKAIKKVGKLLKVRFFVRFFCVVLFIHLCTGVVFLQEGGGKSLLGRKNWKERLFELSESALEYYEKSNETESPLGSVSLYEVTSVKVCPSVVVVGFCFEVSFSLCLSGCDDCGQRALFCCEHKDSNVSNPG
jgi:hypothetical protein